MRPGTSNALFLSIGSHVASKTEGMEKDLRVSSTGAKLAQPNSLDFFNISISKSRRGSTPANIFDQNTRTPSDTVLHSANDAIETEQASPADDHEGGQDDAHCDQTPSRRPIDRFKAKARVLGKLTGLNVNILHVEPKPWDEAVRAEPGFVKALTTAPEARTSAQVHCLSRVLMYCPCFEGMYERSTLLKVCARLYHRTVPAGEAFIKEGDDSDVWYILVSGSAEIFVNSGANNVKICINTITGGASVGEFGLIYDSKRSASILACHGGLMVACLNKGPYLDLLREFHITKYFLSLQKKMEFLSEWRMFRIMPPNVIVALSYLLNFETHKKGTILFDRKSSSNKALCFIKSGCCTMVATSTPPQSDGEDHETDNLVMSVEKGYIFGVAVSPPCISKIEVFSDDSVELLVADQLEKKLGRFGTLIMSSLQEHRAADEATLHARLHMLSNLHKEIQKHQEVPNGRDIHLPLLLDRELCPSWAHIKHQRDSHQATLKKRNEDDIAHPSRSTLPDMEDDAELLSPPVLPAAIRSKNSKPRSSIDRMGQIDTSSPRLFPKDASSRASPSTTSSFSSLPSVASSSSSPSARAPSSPSLMPAEHTFPTRSNASSPIPSLLRSNNSSPTSRLARSNTSSPTPLTRSNTSSPTPFLRMSHMRASSGSPHTASPTPGAGGYFGANVKSGLRILEPLDGAGSNDWKDNLEDEVFIVFDASPQVLLTSVHGRTDLFASRLRVDIASSLLVPQNCIQVLSILPFGAHTTSLRTIASISIDSAFLPKAHHPRGILAVLIAEISRPHGKFFQGERSSLKGVYSIISCHRGGYEATGAILSAVDDTQDVGCVDQTENVLSWVTRLAGDNFALHKVRQ